MFDGGDRIRCTRQGIPLRMITRQRIPVTLVTLFLVTACFVPRGEPMEVPAGIDHADYNRLLGKYVDDRGQVDYAAWTRAADDRAALRRYLARFGELTGAAATGADKAASLINAYNALTIDWILEHFPVRGIKQTDDPWTAKRHRVGGELVSLNDIEHGTLRPEFGYRVHAVLVCAAKSCPPLRNQAFTADGLDAQLDDAMRRWLARPDLNRFRPADNVVELSKIFSWYREDFEKVDGGLRAVLARYGPPEFGSLLNRADYRLEFRPYDWALNAP